MFAVRLPHPGEDVSHLEAFDFTKMNAVNTCPRWGIIRYGLHKVMPTKSRSMALEAGSACHEVFSAVRIFDLLEYGHILYGDDADIKARQCARSLFGRKDYDGSIIYDRADEMLRLFKEEGEDERTRVLRGCLYILESSGYEDDPNDKRRTLDKLSEACIAYIDRHEFGKSLPYIRGDFVGIEVPFNLVVTYVCDIGNNLNVHRSIRLTGRIDGFHCYRNDLNTPMVEENKTASRLNDAWEMSFDMSHQVTGYCVAASTILGTLVNRALIRGLAIPQPRVYDAGGLSNPFVQRHPHHYEEWTRWVMHTVETFFRWKDDPLHSPTYTGSCNRYFRPCSYIPLCAADEEERQEYFEMMVEDEWSPLHTMESKAGE